MAVSCRLLVAILLGLQSGAEAEAFIEELPLDDAGLETDNQCDSREECDSPENSPGHALFQRNKVVRNRLGGGRLPSDSVFGHSDLTHEQQVAAVEELRAVVAKQDVVTKEHLQKLLDMTAAALTQKVNSDGRNPPNVLLHTNATPPFRSSGDALADRDAHDKDYIENGDSNPRDEDDSLMFPKSMKYKREEESEESVNSTLSYEEGEPREMKFVLATYVVLPVAFVFLFIFTVSNLMERFGITAIPESGIMIVIGVILGTFMKMYGNFRFFEDPDLFAEFNSAILNLVLLPIIIFASGWAIRRQDFFSQFPYILMFAVGGVALSTIVIACLINFTGTLKLHAVTRWRTAFAFASLISATDPVATLSTYAKLKVDPLLNIMVFGESIINDAVAIVLFGVFNSDTYMVSGKGHEMEGLQLVASILWGVIKIFSQSTLLGMSLGICYTLIAHWADMRHSKKGQILVIFASCYLTYAAAESMGMSGIIAEMFAALIMGIYMRPHLSCEGSLLATFFVKQVALLADAAVSLLIGVSVVQLTTKGWWFGLWVMLFCLVGRCASVFPIGLCVNWIKEMVGRANGVPREGWNLLSPQVMFMMWHAGLRGAIAMALSLELGKWVDEYDGEGTRRALQTATFFILCTFLLVFGGTTTTCLSYLGIPMKQDLASDHLAKSEVLGPVRGFLTWLDKKIFTPILLGHTLFDKNSGEEEKDVEDVLKDVQRW